MIKRSNIVTIRPEQPSDYPAIDAVITQAFAGMPYSQNDEAPLVRLLRQQGALTVSLVAEQDGAVVGHIGFSPALPADGALGWYALGPLAVVPGCQRTGIGSLLVNQGLDALAGLNANGCILIGHTGYYQRFGFVVMPEFAPDCERQHRDHFMLKGLADALPRAPIAFHPAFYHAADFPLNDSF